MIFTAEGIRDRLHVRPFAPMRVVTTTGQTYDVYHPDMVFVTRQYMMVGIPAADNATVPDMATRIALVHVTELRDLPVPAAPSTDPSPAA